MISRKDFKAVADIIRKYNILRHDQMDLYEMSIELCSYFKKANPTFDKGKFLKAAGWYQE